MSAPGRLGWRAPICLVAAGADGKNRKPADRGALNFGHYFLFAANQACISAISFSCAVIIASAIALVDGSVAN